MSCFGIGWLLGYPALRVQHHYLAFVTLAFATLAYLVFRNEEWITGGIYGISNVPRPSLFGYSLGKPRDFYYFCLANLALVSLAAWWLIRSPWGRAFVALRENPLRALSLGIDTRRYTLMAFALGAGLGGISGVLYAPLVQYIDPTPFALLLSLNLLLMVIVGGSGYFFGPFVGALVAVLLPEWLQGVDNAYWLFGPLAETARSLLPPAILKSVAEALPRRLRDLRHGAAGVQPGRHHRLLRAALCVGAAPRAARRLDRGEGGPMSAVLEVRDLKKSFGGIVAVDGVSFEVNEGEILGIIGPNGSGKSTLFNCILGQLQPTSGEVRLDGRAVTGMRPCDLNRLGVSRTFQLLQVFPELSVRENLILAAQEHKGTMLSRLFGARDAGLSGDAERMIEFFSPGAGRRQQGRRALLWPTKTARRRDGFHGRPAPRAARRAGRRREPHDAGEPARAAGSHQQARGRHLRGDRTQHGVRDAAVLPHHRSRRRQDHRRGRP